MLLNRRDFLAWTGLACVAPHSPQTMASFLNAGNRGLEGSLRCINVVNFIRGVEPRFETDLLLPVQKQMDIILQHKLPATWLLQYDALVSGEFVNFLKKHIADNHEVGFWFEMNEMLCKAADVDWRGRPGYEWDHLPHVAFTIGYTPAERIKLADTAMKTFRETWGKVPKSVACWNLDSITMAHLTSRYKIDAYAVCRDQIATDGFTIWGAPIAGYYPSKTNCWSPALSPSNQIGTPVFRMLGQDPVHYYDRRYKLPDGRVTSEPDTMEPVWASGRSTHFVSAFLKMISDDPCLRFAYAQLGQENSFRWRDMADAYPRQMESLAQLRDAGTIHVETMGESGRRFKKSFRSTPVQAQVMLDDPFGSSSPSESSIWYQSRTYRANLHIKGDLPFFRDITVYSDDNPQPFLNEATRQNDVEQRMPAVVDGYHWSTSPDSSDDVGAGGFFLRSGDRMRLAGRPQVREEGGVLYVDLPFLAGGTARIKFTEDGVSIKFDSKVHETFAVSFEWDPTKSAMKGVSPQRVTYRWIECDYSVTVAKGKAELTQSGWKVTPTNGEILLKLAQSA